MTRIECKEALRDSKVVQNRLGWRAVVSMGILATSIGVYMGWRKADR